MAQEILSEILNQLKQVPPAEWVGIFAGTAGVYLSIKEKLFAWPLFITCYLAYIYLSFHAELYAALLLNFVFIFISIYGWRNWIHSSKSGHEKFKIQKTPLSQILIAIVSIITFTLLLGWGLKNYTTAYLPFLDAFATSCAFVAQWMLSKKYIENWIFWIIADTVYVGLWSAQGYYVSAVLFLIFICLATKGWFEWKRMVNPTRC